MLFRQLQYLTALAKEEHFGRAAARCNVSQPSLSTAVKQLELTFGVPIVLRGRRFLGFTNEGQRIIKWAERITSQRDAMLVELSGMRENFEGQLRLGAMPNSSPVLPLFSKLLAEKHPGVEVLVLLVPARLHVEPGLVDSRAADDVLVKALRFSQQHV